MISTITDNLNIVLFRIYTAEEEINGLADRLIYWQIQ